MPDKAVIRGDFADLKFIKSRSVCQIVIEAPIEAGPDIVRAFGTPLPGSTVPVAIARIVDTPKKSPQKPQDGKEHRRMEELPAVQQAALVCKRADFWVYLVEEHDEELVGASPTEEQAADFVRDWCHVTSRSQILPGTQAEQRWQMLLSAYEGWRAATEAGAT